MGTAKIVGDRVKFETEIPSYDNPEVMQPFVYTIDEKVLDQLGIDYKNLPNINFIK